MNDINYFKVFVLYSGDMTADANYLHIKRIHLIHLVGYCRRGALQYVGIATNEVTFSLPFTPWNRICIHKDCTVKTS
jgi:hypothetical protein